MENTRLFASCGLVFFLMYERNVHLECAYSLHFIASCEFSTLVATLLIPVDTSGFSCCLERSCIRIYPVTCSLAVSKFSTMQAHNEKPHLHCTCLWTELCVRLQSMQITVFLFFSPDGRSKHVILFESVDEQLVTIGFVWWQLLNTPSAPRLDTSNISMMFTHLQGRSTPCYPCRECLKLKPPFWKNKTWYHGNGPASPL